MRSGLILVPLVLCTSPALAQAVLPPPPASNAAQQVQRALNDPAMVDRLTGTMQALSQALLDLPVGAIRAAAEGRPPSPAERHMTVRDMARRDNPNFDRDFQRRMAQTGPMVKQSMRALSQAVPEMMQGLKQAERALDRAAANMPDPTYPNR